MNSFQLRVWTIGHSTRPLAELIEALGAHHITLLADVRAFPASRRNPQYSRESLECELPAAGIRYEWLGESLGGRRPAPKDSLDLALRNASFRGYAAHMRSEKFRAGIAKILEYTAHERVAIMCAEKLWWRCHRSMIADYLVGVRGIEVEHIYDARRSDSHRLKPIARVDGDFLFYDLEATGDLLRHPD